MNMDPVSSEGETVVHTEDVVQALIDHLVEPFLPARTSSALDRFPSLPMQQAVAKQIHAVVLLYNYYHRKQFPQLEFLDFETFCKVAIIAKPSILAHIKPRGRCNAESYDPNKQLSITEEMIMGACNICLWLDASRDVPIMDGCPVSKVAVFLTDSTKKNCLLLNSSITQGVWSLIEKNLDDSSNKSERMLGKKNTSKRKRTTERLLGDEPSADDYNGLQQFALSVVKETTGIDQMDLMVLESHVVYSLSEEKTVTRVYFMKCTKSIHKDVIPVPIADAINSLKGPLVKKIFDNYTVSPVVEYFHLLPYAEILADWLSRETLPLPNSSQPWEGQGSSDMECSDKPSKKEVDENNDRSYGTCQTAYILDNKTNNIINETMNPKENGECFMSGLPNFFCSSHNLVEGNSSVVCPMSEDKCKAAQNVVPVDPVVEKIKSLGDLSITKSCCKDKTRKDDLIMKPCNNVSTSQKFASESDLCNVGFSGKDGMLTGNHSLVPFQSNSQIPDKAQAIPASKVNELLQAALKVLWKKRDELSFQQRHLQDEIALCNKSLQTILSEDDLMLKTECIIEAFNDRWSMRTTQTHKEKCLHDREQCSPQNIKRKKISEAIINLGNPCQELDEICYANNWMPPTFVMLPSNGGFKYNVTVQGEDFECSSVGDPRANLLEARESAAASMLSKLRSMATQAQ